MILQRPTWCKSKVYSYVQAEVLMHLPPTENIRYTKATNSTTGSATPDPKGSSIGPENIHKTYIVNN